MDLVAGERRIAGLSVSTPPVTRSARTRGPSCRGRSSTASASAQLVGSGTVGPQAMTTSGSPRTSLTGRLTTARARTPGEASARDCGKVLAHAVHLVDGGHALAEPPLIASSPPGSADRGTRAGGGGPPRSGRRPGRRPRVRARARGFAPRRGGRPLATEVFGCAACSTSIRAGAACLRRQERRRHRVVAGNEQDPLSGAASRRRGRSRAAAIAAAGLAGAEDEGSAARRRRQETRERRPGQRLRRRRRRRARGRSGADRRADQT